MTLSRFAAVQWLSFLVAAVSLVHVLSPILTPFVAAGIFAYICNSQVALRHGKTWYFLSTMYRNQ